MHAARRIEAALHVDAHDHRAALLDFANFTQLDIIAEAGNQRGLQIESGHVAAGVSREEQENNGADGERPECDSGRSHSQRVVQAAGGAGAALDRLGDGALGAAPHFEAYKSGNSEGHEHKEKDEKTGIDRQDRRGQHRRERHQRQK